MRLPLAAAFAGALATVANTASPLRVPQADPTFDAKDLAAVKQVRARIEERAKKTAANAGKPYKVTIPNTTVTYEMAPIPAGEFLMGSAAPDAKPDEQPQHKVRLDAFWMQTHEVTWDAFLMFMFADQAKELDHPDALVDALSRPTAPHLEMSFGRGNQGFPAISMTQHAANKFAQWVSAKTGEYYRLPTEAEWEYACKAGMPDGKGEGQLDEYAWFAGNSATQAFPRGTYHTIGTKKPNARGLYDTLGNVMEWTLDQYVPYTADPQENPWVKSTKSYPHAVRGGSWDHDASHTRSAYRDWYTPSRHTHGIGFRVAATPRT